MAVIFINPNSTASMTALIAEEARRAAPSLKIEGWTSHDGPPSIQGRADGDAATGPLMPLIDRASSEGADCIVIACFDDTGLAQARERAACPVIGIGQAACHAATLIADRFSVVTSLAVSVPILEENIALYGLSGSLGRVRASGLPVLAIEDDPDAAHGAIMVQSLAARDEDGAGCLVLGCAGMAGLAARLRETTGLPVVDGVQSAAIMAQAIVAASPARHGSAAEAL